MGRNTDRIRTTHVGSLGRPPALMEYLRKIADNEPYDKGGYEACLTDSVIEAVRLQAESGIDIVSDGEYGKSVNWAFYVHGRLKGLERRPLTPEDAKDPMSVVLGGR